MAKRAHAHTIEIDSSHVSYISQPGAVTRLISGPPLRKVFRKLDVSTRRELREALTQQFA